MTAAVPETDGSSTSRGPSAFSKTTRVLPRRVWIVLYVLGFVILIAIGVGVFGTIPIRVQGTGMLLSTGGIVQVTTGVQGKVGQVKVKTDDPVRPGDIVCTLDLSTVRVDLETEQKKLGQLKMNKALNDPIELQQMQELRVSIRSQERIVTDTERRWNNRLATNDDVLREKDKLSQLRQRLESLENSVATRDKEILESDGKVKLLLKQLQSGDIRSPVEGRIIEISTQNGDVLQPGKSIVRIERPGDLVAVLFVPAADGKKVRAEKEYEVQIVPDDLKQWGYIRGTVRSVSRFPASPERLKFIFGNDQVVKDFLKQCSSSMEIRVGLKKDAGTMSGVVWVPPPGYTQRLKSQTKCTGRITVERKIPISYVLPIGRKR